MSVVALLQTCDRELGNGIKGEASDPSDPLGCGRRLSGSVHSRLSPSGELGGGKEAGEVQKGFGPAHPLGSRQRPFPSASSENQMVVPGQLQ